VIHKELHRINQTAYARNGMLAMLQRDATVKPAPERFQNVGLKFDIVVTFEKRVFDTVVEELGRRVSPLSSCTHVINIETVDNHAEARMSSFIVLQLANYLHSHISGTLAHAYSALNDVKAQPSPQNLAAPPRPTHGMINPMMQKLVRPEGAPNHADSSLWHDALYHTLSMLEDGMGVPVAHHAIWY
jgi:hypothetical protein